MSNEWIEWNGGERPVCRDDLVDLKFRSGNASFGSHAYSWLWHHYSTSGDIIAYRLHQPEEETLVSDGGWIKCSERMPEEMVDVLITDGDDVCLGWLACAEPLDILWEYPGSAVRGLETHWQPLPAPPKGE